MGAGSSTTSNPNPDAISEKLFQSIKNSGSITDAIKLLQAEQAAQGAATPAVDSTKTTSTPTQQAEAEVETTEIKQGGKRHTKGKQLKRKKQKKRTIRK